MQRLLWLVITRAVKKPPHLEQRTAKAAESTENLVGPDTKEKLSTQRQSLKAAVFWSCVSYLSVKTLIVDMKKIFRIYSNTDGYQMLQFLLCFKSSVSKVGKDHHVPCRLIINRAKNIRSPELLKLLPESNAVCP